MIDQHEINRLRSLAEQALLQAPGRREVYTTNVWNAILPVYTLADPYGLPLELAFAAAAQNALLELLDEVEMLRAWREKHLREREKADPRQVVRAALRDSGGNPGGHGSAEAEPDIRDDRLLVPVVNGGCSDIGESGRGRAVPTPEIGDGSRPDPAGVIHKRQAPARKAKRVQS